MLLSRSTREYKSGCKPNTIMRKRKVQFNFHSNGNIHDPENKNIKKGIHVTMDGRKIKISDMANEHLVNGSNFGCKDTGSYWRIAVPLFRAELKKRHNYNKQYNKMEKALIAIRARINGEFDNKELKKYGPLSSSNEDVLRLIDKVIKY